MELSIKREQLTCKQAMLVSWDACSPGNGLGVWYLGHRGTISFGQEKRRLLEEVDKTQAVQGGTFEELRRAARSRVSGGEGER